MKRSLRMPEMSNENHSRGKKQQKAEKPKKQIDKLSELMYNKFCVVQKDVLIHIGRGI